MREHMNPKTLPLSSCVTLEHVHTLSPSVKVPVLIGCHEEEIRQQV